MKRLSRKYGHEYSIVSSNRKIHSKDDGKQNLIDREREWEPIFLNILIRYSFERN